ncbi:MAG: DUF1573 domain-containing protein [Planctomycetales bacterium]
MASSATIQRSLMVVFLAIPSVWGGVVSLGKPQLHAVQKGEKPGGLVFDQYLLDLRGIPQQASEVLYFYFSFQNVGTTPVHIAELKGSCGCLQPRLTRENPIYQPGEKGEFRLAIQTANQSRGEQEYTVDVNYNDPEPRSRKVKLKVILPQEQVTVRPRALMIYTTNGEQLTQPQMITVEDPRSSALTVLGARCENKYVDLKLISGGDRDENGKLTAKLQVEVKGPVSVGVHNISR